METRYYPFTGEIDVEGLTNSVAEKARRYGDEVEIVAVDQSIEAEVTWGENVGQARRGIPYDQLPTVNGRIT